MDGLIETGHTWMKPLRDFRNMLYSTTLPENKAEYRSSKRRNGTVTVVTSRTTGEEKHILGPYKMEHRRKFLAELLGLQKGVDRNNPGPKYELITKAELESIRVQWRLDPNEPDWEDTVPKIYREVMGEMAGVEWEVNDDFVFAGGEEELISTLCERHGLAKEMFMKLIELEISFEGHSRRAKLQERLGELLARDWSEHTAVLSRKMDQRVSERGREDQEKALQERYENLMGVLGDAS
jgi:DNA sulfur modification protein DndC